MGGYGTSSSLKMGVSGTNIGHSGNSDYIIFFLNMKTGVSGTTVCMVYIYIFFKWYKRKIYFLEMNFCQKIVCLWYHVKAE